MESIPAKTENLMRYDGRLSSIYGIWLKNLILSLLTLGIYRAWAKTHMRRYLWSCYTIDNDRLEYTGKGMELFRGFMKVVLIFFAISFVGTMLLMVMGKTPEAKLLTHAQNILVYGLVVLLLFYGRFSALRYRLTRSQWRGIRGRLVGDAKPYVVFRLKRAAIDILTLGYCIGRSNIMDNRYLIESAYLGNQKCTYTGETNALDRINLITLLLAIPTIGISRYWYKAALLNEKYNNLKVGTVYFRPHYTAGKFFRLGMGNLLILIFTLFLGMPIIIQRIMRFFSENVEVLGSIEGSAIMQVDGHADNWGEGIDDQLDYDGIDWDAGII